MVDDVRLFKDPDGTWPIYKLVGQDWVLVTDMATLSAGDELKCGSEPHPAETFEADPATGFDQFTVVSDYEEHEGYNTILCTPHA